LYTATIHDSDVYISVKTLETRNDGQCWLCHAWFAKASSIYFVADNAQLCGGAVVGCWNYILYGMCWVI